MCIYVELLKKNKMNLAQNGAHHLEPRVSGVCTLGIPMLCHSEAHARMCAVLFTKARCRDNPVLPESHLCGHRHLLRHLRWMSLIARSPMGKAGKQPVIDPTGCFLYGVAHGAVRTHEQYSFVTGDTSELHTEQVHILFFVLGGQEGV